jgi:phosphoglycolate phosphatase
MKFKAVIFDLDGTLINSLEDIADSMNTVLKTNKYLPIIMKLIIIL